MAEMSDNGKIVCRGLRNLARVSASESTSVSLPVFEPEHHIAWSAANYIEAIEAEADRLRLAVTSAFEAMRDGDNAKAFELLIEAASTTDTKEQSDG